MLFKVSSPFTEDAPWWQWQGNLSRYGLPVNEQLKIQKFALKALVLAESACEECLFLDADNFPLQALEDVRALLYEHDAAFWPDVSDAPARGLWDGLGAGKAQDSGQLLVRKTAPVQRALVLAALFAVRQDIFLEALYGAPSGGIVCGFGDKDAFQVTAADSGH